MRKMKRSTFIDQVNYYHCITDKHGLPVRAYAEPTYNIQGEYAIKFDERLNWDDMESIKKWLDDNRVEYSTHNFYDYPIDFYTGEHQTEPRFYTIIVLSNDNFIKQ